MIRFRLMLTNEFKLFRTSIPIHAVAIVQPTVMYLLMSAILVFPTFDMNVTQPTTPRGEALVAAMGEVGAPVGKDGAPIGLSYINPVIVPPGEGVPGRQVITVSEGEGGEVAVQRYGLIDSNLVKNLRNRLTAAALIVWNEDLGEAAVTIEQYPWLPRDVSYSVYFGMALLPMTAFLAASIIGAILTAQEFEFETIVEYRLAPVPTGLILAARLVRLALTSYLAVVVLLVAIGLVTGAWPGSLWRVALTILPLAVIAGCLGMVAGLIIRKTIPAFLIGLVCTFAFWLLGSAFGLAAGFGTGYQLVSLFSPNTHAVELIFPSYYGAVIGTPLVSCLILTAWSALMMFLVAVVYAWRVRR